MIALPAGALMFFKRTGTREYSREEFLSLPPEYDKFGGCWQRDGNFYAPEDFSQIHMINFLNHSNIPNLSHVPSGDIPRSTAESFWRTTRAIQVDDELTVDYTDLWILGYGCRKQVYD